MKAADQSLEPQRASVGKGNSLVGQAPATPRGRTVVALALASWAVLFLIVAVGFVVFSSLG